MTTKAKKPEGVTIKVGGVVSNGQGGHFREGTEAEGLSDETITSLKAKGYI